MLPRILNIIVGLIAFQIIAFPQSSDIVYFDFETNSSIILTNDTSNVWQIGTPNKSLFLESRSGTFAILTDTISSYPPNNRSTFHFTIYKPQYDQYCALWFSYWHYFDMDTITDFAYVDFSYNGGEDWYQGTDWDLNFEDFYFSRYYEGPNIGGDFDPTITGNSRGWVKDEYTMHWYYGVKKGTADAIYPDSIMIIFNFNSDSIQTNRDGWMIDDIRVEKLICGGVPSKESEHYIIFPNPVGSSIQINANHGAIETVQILNLSGNCVLEKPNINSNTIILNLDDIDSGIYLLVVKDEFNFKTIEKIVKH